MRRVTRIAEIVGLDDGQYRLEEIYGFEQLGVDGHGMAHGEFYVTGYVPQCLRRIRAAGLNLSPELFAARRIRHNGRAQRESLLIPETNAGLAVAADSMPNDARPAVSPDDASLNVGSMDLAASIPEPSIEAASGAVLPAQVDLASSSCMPISVDAMATNVSHTLPPILAAATSNGAHVPTNGPPAPMHVLAALAMRQRQRESVEVALKGWAKDDGSTLAK
jgi:hypothetical protein